MKVNVHMKNRDLAIEVPAGKILVCLDSASDGCMNGRDHQYPEKIDAQFRFMEGGEVDLTSEDTSDVVQFLYDPFFFYELDANNVMYFSGWLGWVGKRAHDHIVDPDYSEVLDDYVIAKSPRVFGRVMCISPEEASEKSGNFEVYMENGNMRSGTARYMSPEHLEVVREFLRQPKEGVRDYSIHTAKTTKRDGWRQSLIRGNSVFNLYHKYNPDETFWDNMSLRGITP